MDHTANNRVNEKWAEELALRIRALDQEAFREYVFSFAPPFARYLRKKGLPDSDAEMLSLKIAEKAALEIRGGKYQFRREGGVIAWSFSIARLEMSGWYRRNISATPIEDFENLADEKSNRASNPEDSMLPNETVQAVREAVAKLSPDDQAIIHLRFLDFTLSYDEIGVRLGIQNGAARTRCSRASDRLKRLLEADSRIQPILQHKLHK